MEGKSGAAVVVHSKLEDGTWEMSGGKGQELGELRTVYEAELVGISMALEVILGMVKDQPRLNFNFYILADNQSALLNALSPLHSPGQQLRSRILSLYTNILQASPSAALKLVWVPGHQGIEGNEEADDWAKKAAMGELEHDIEAVGSGSQASRVKEGRMLDDFLNLPKSSKCQSSLTTNSYSISNGENNGNKILLPNTSDESTFTHLQPTFFDFTIVFLVLSPLSSPNSDLVTPSSMPTSTDQSALSLIDASAELERTSPTSSSPVPISQPNANNHYISRSSRNEPSLPTLVALRHPSHSPIHRLDWQIPSLSFKQGIFEVEGEEAQYPAHLQPRLAPPISPALTRYTRFDDSPSFRLNSRADDNLRCWFRLNQQYFTQREHFTPSSYSSTRSSPKLPYPT